MFKVIICLFLYSISLIFVSLSASQYLEYSVIALPDDFEITPHYSSMRSLNAQGQVAGVMKERAAFWDKNRGISLVPIEGKTDSTMLNDYGFVCIHQQQLGKQALLWDTNTNEIHQGSWGRPYAINNLNDVLIYNDYSCDIWNVNSGLFSQISSGSLINNNGIILNSWKNGFSFFSFNDNGNALARKINDIFFYSKDKFYGISFSKESFGYVYLNNLDEVFSLVYTDSGKTKRAISKWKKDQKICISETLEEISELKDYYILDIKGVNDLGEVLISSVKRNENIKKCFILIQKK